MKPIQHVLARLKGVRRQGDGWTARCPAHDDHQPSLSVTETAAGKVLLCCFAGCSAEAVVEAMGLAWQDLFPEPDSRLALKEQSRRRIVATYDYTDAEGAPLFQTVRYEPKTFRQRRPGKRGGWVWNLKGIEPVLYRLPRVLEAAQAGHRVFVVEGEKDVHALETLGFTATTNPMGAGKWQATYAEALRGARVVVLPDADEAGRAHAQVVTESLRGVAADVRLTQLPDLGPKGDVSDWVAAGGTAEALEALVEAVRSRKQSQARRQEAGGADGAAAPSVGVLISEVEREQVRWLWPGRIALGKLTILDGDPGLGKSTLAYDLAARITSNRALPTGESPPPGGVLILSTEDGLGDTIRPRLEAAGADLARCLAVQTLPGESEEEPERVPIIPDDLPLLAHAARRVEARLLIIDPLMAHLGPKTNAYKDADVRRALAPLSRFAEEHALAVVVIRHLNKMSGGSPLYRGGGSIGLIGAARSGLLVGRDPMDESRLVLASVKSNLARKPDSLAFRVTSSAADADVPVVEWEGTCELGAADLLASSSNGRERSATEKAEAWLEAVLAESPFPAAKVYDLAEEAGIAKRTLKRAKRSLRVVAERVVGLGSGGYWVWALPEAASPASDAAKGANRGDGPLSEDKIEEQTEKELNHAGMGDFTKGANPAEDPAKGAKLSSGIPTSNPRPFPGDSAHRNGQVPPSGDGWTMLEL